MGGGVSGTEFDSAPERLNGFCRLIQFDQVAPQFQPASRVFGILIEKFTGVSDSAVEDVWIELGQLGEINEARVSLLACGVSVASTFVKSTTPRWISLAVGSNDIRIQRDPRINSARV